MKQSILFFLVFILAAASGCTPRPTDRSLEAWLAEDPDSCLWYHTGLYPSLVQARQYDSLERMYARLLRAMPPHPATGPDTEYLTGWVISYYYNAQVLQDKTEGGGILRQPDAERQPVLRLGHASRTVDDRSQVLPGGGAAG